MMALCFDVTPRPGQSGRHLALTAWRVHEAQHRTQTAGRESVFSDYRLRVAQVIRSEEPDYFADHVDHVDHAGPLGTLERVRLYLEPRRT